MSLSAGARLGSYEILSPLGAGGMGEVWRARDSKLGREVALKILPDVFATDPDRLARFRREAQVLASLNHAHIGAIYGLEETNGLEALVLELVDGPTLADRIAQGPLPLDEALEVARQIADALAAAHEQGIIHRDLKPSNIKLRPDGTVKVLDFGLAKALEPAGSAVTDQLTSPTLTARGTQMGLIIGTAAYMAPEQARGRPVDERADIWAFGCVLYEMLTARRTFGGEEASETLAFVITREPDWTALPVTTPAAIHRVLRRALEKERSKRLSDIRDARLELDEAAASPPPPPLRATTSRRERLIWASLVAVLALTAIVTAVRTSRPIPAASELRVDIVTPPLLDSSLAVSPDSRKVAFVAAQNNRWLLWVQALDSGGARPLPGTEGGRLPFWSSDSASIGFFTEGQLKRVDIAGGLPLTLAPIVTPGGGTWHGDTILYAPNSSFGPIYRIPAGGGEAAPVTQPKEPEIGHRHPQFLPDGRHFLYSANSGSGLRKPIYVGDVGGSQASRLLDADGSPVYSGTGHLLFVRNGTLFAQEFDVRALALRGTPVPIGQDVAVSGTLVQSAVSASATGVVVYRTGSAVGRRRLVWFDRSGKELGTFPQGALGGTSNPWLSPDGRRLAVHATTDGNVDVWILDIARGVFSRFTSHPAPDALPVWSPDGRQIVFNSLRDATADLYVKAADGSGEEQPLSVSPGSERASDWSKDGRLLLFKVADPSGRSDIWALPLEDPKKPFRVVGGPADERDAQFSPDAKWIAYQSDESGRPEIYLQRFPGPGDKERVSTDGGTQVRWRPDGKELFYVDPDNTLMAVTIRLPAADGAPTLGTPSRLFSTRLVQAGLAIARQQYVVSSDGQRFLANTLDEPEAKSITLLLNWHRR